jgi:outer membrane protein OmpA-like peptidoglycan-associated protein
VKWFVGILAVLLVVAVGISEYAGYRSLKEMRAEIRGLHQDVNEATRTVQEESAAVAASSRSAQEAAAKAAVAADGQRQAEAGRQQAEAAAQQAAVDSQAAQQKMEEMRREREAELDRMQQALNKVVETRRTSNGMVISLPNSVFRFDFDKSDLTQHNREILSRVAGILLASKGYGISIFGYTDDLGSAEYNQQLSLRRADSVKDYLVQAGIDTAIINVKGYGKMSPLVEGDSNASRAKNRRVEIALTDSSVRY